jgi:hypothetical protein
MVEYDSTYVFMDLASAQDFLQVSDPPRVNVLAVSVDDYELNGKSVRQEIVEAFHARRPCNNPEQHGANYFGGYRCGLYRTMTWEQSKRVLLQAVEVEKGMMYILLSFIVVVAGFNIVAIYTLVVRAKTRDIGILRALGGTEGGVTSIFLMSGGLCGLFGSIFGIILGLLIALNLNEILDFIRVVSREMNRMGLERDRGLNVFERGSTVVAAAALTLALLGLIWNWMALYKQRLRHPWVRMIAAGLALAAAAWFSTGWMTDYRPHDNYDATFTAGSRGLFTGIIVLLWALFCAAWRLCRNTVCCSGSDVGTTMHFFTNDDESAAEPLRPIIDAAKAPPSRSFGGRTRQNTFTFASSAMLLLCILYVDKRVADT